MERVLRVVHEAEGDELLDLVEDALKVGGASAGVGAGLRGHRRPAQGRRGRRDEATGRTG